MFFNQYYVFIQTLMHARFSHSRKKTESRLPKANPKIDAYKNIALFLYRSSRHHYGSFDSKEDVHSMTSINSPARVIDNLHVKLIFDLGKKVNSRKGLTKISKIAKFWLRNVVKLGKYSLAKFAYFVSVVLRAEIVTIFEPKMLTISARNTNIYKLCKTIFSKLYNIS
jgi:hypothetical protein